VYSFYPPYFRFDILKDVPKNTNFFNTKVKIPCHVFECSILTGMIFLRLTIFKLHIFSKLFAFSDLLGLTFEKKRV